MQWLLACSEPAAFSLCLHRVKLIDLVENIPRTHRIPAEAQLLFTLLSLVYRARRRGRWEGGGKGKRKREGKTQGGKKRGREIQKAQCVESKEFGQESSVDRTSTHKQP